MATIQVDFIGSEYSLDRSGFLLPDCRYNSIRNIHICYKITPVTPDTIRGNNNCSNTFFNFKCDIPETNVVGNSATCTTALAAEDANPLQL